MNTQDIENITTVLCLFHTREHAQEALADLQKSDIPAKSISVISSQSKSSGAAGQSLSALQQLNLPEGDRKMLSDGLNAGGSIIVVSGPEAYTDTAEDIFGRHRAAQVDEKVITDDMGRQPVAAMNTNADAVVPVVEEVLVSKETTERMEHVTDTICRTEVEVEPVDAIETSAKPQGTQPWQATLRTQGALKTGVSN